MTYPSEPTRWTHSPDEAPELLRGAFEACRHEGPSDLQMRTLALKLAALSSGAAVAASAASAKAATLATGSGTAAGAAGGSSILSFAKVAVSLALVGAAATGTVLLQRAHPAADARRTAGAVSSAQQPAAAVVIETGTSASGASARELARQVAPTVAPNVRPLVQPLAAEDTRDGADGSADGSGPTGRASSALNAGEGDLDRVEARGGRAESAGRTSRRARRVTNAVKRADVVARAARKREEPVEQREETTSKPEESSAGEAVEETPSEIELLRSARASLDARPRQAFRTTEQHRSLYPEGVFAQERDALAVEALARAGDVKLARELAEAFIRRYPSSPHAHRFRETMNLQ